MMATNYLQAAIFLSRFINTHQRTNEEISVGIPARLRVLMRLEAVAAGQFEIDLFLEQDRFFPQELADGSF